MTGVLLDTSGYSAFMRGHSGVAAALRRVDGISLNPVVLGELLAGFRRGRDRARNERELEEFLSSPRSHVVEIDRETASRYATIVAFLRASGTPVPTNDIWIAASAMQHGLTLLTTDADFLRVPQVLVDHHPVA